MSNLSVTYRASADSIFISKVHNLILLMFFAITHCAQEPHSIEAADIQENEDSSSAENSPASPVTEVDNVPFNQSGNVTQRTETSLPFPVTSDNTDEAERKNIYVLCSGKSQEFFIYPLEKISVLLQEACVWAKKKPEKMNLVFEDDVDKKSIILISAGKTKILFIFPSEKISVLLQEACEWAGKKPQNMQLVFEELYRITGHWLNYITVANSTAEFIVIIPDKECSSVVSPVQLVAEVNTHLNVRSPDVYSTSTVEYPSTLSLNNRPGVQWNVRKIFKRVRRKGVPDVRWMKVLGDKAAEFSIGFTGFLGPDDTHNEAVTDALLVFSTVFDRHEHGNCQK
ncbi:hypothetical protein NFI96_028830, partial [Prochilodus magdalenae]